MRTILLIAAAVCFGLGAVGFRVGNLSLTSAGLCLFMVSLLL